MKTEDALFQEIFDSSSVRESLGAVAPISYAKSEPQLPMDNDPFWFENATNGRSAQRVADDAFVKEISGHEPVFGSGVAATNAGIIDFPILDGIVGAEFIPSVRTFTKRAKENEIQKATPRRRAAIRACFEKHLKPLLCKRWENGPSNDFDFRLDALAESGVQLVNQSMMEAL